jgi:hypothetical protein
LNLLAEFAQARHRPCPRHRPGQSQSADCGLLGESW